VVAVAVSGSSARAEILERIRSANAGAVPPPPPEPMRERPGDPRLFEARVEEYRAGVTRLDDERETGATVAAILARHGAAGAVVPAGLPDSWHPPGVEVIVDDGRLTVAEVDRVEAAVTGSLLAIAATGTIVLDAGPRCGRRLLSLLPDLHVCVVR
jgi:L-lactate dehydrogenase complex protein LldG